MNKAIFSSTFPLSHLLIDGIKITYEANALHLSKFFSLEDLLKFQKLLEESQLSPKTAYIKVLEWQKKAPTNPALDNLLTYLHLRHKQVGKAEKLIEESYQKHSEYFFAKINYADQSLRKGDLEKIPLIFPSLNLKELFPLRDSFHVSEYRGFMTLLGHYYIALKDTNSAKACYQNAYTADPTHPSVIILEKKLYPKRPFTKLLQKIIQLARIS